MRMSVFRTGASLILLVAAFPAAAEEPASREPRLLSTSAKAKMLQDGGSTPPVARRPAGSYPLVQAPPTESEPTPPARPTRSSAAAENRSRGSSPVGMSDRPSGTAGRDTEKGTPSGIDSLVTLPGGPMESSGGDTWVDDQGRIQGRSVAERMNNIRRRAVDADLSRSFVAPQNEDTYTVEPPIADPSYPTTTVRDPRPTLAQPSVTEGFPTPSRRSPVRTAPLGRPSAEFRAPGRSDQGLLFSNRAPAIAFETVGPRKIIIGKEAEYKVVMTNHGEMDADNVIVTVKLPPWAEIVSSGASIGAPQVETVQGQMFSVEWRIAKLKAKGNEFLTLTVIPRDSRPFDLAVGWAFAPETGMAQIEVQEPKLEMAISGPDEVMYGATEVYSIALLNPGTGDAENVVLNLLPVAAHQHMAGSRSIGTIKAGERKTIEIELTAHQAGRIQIKAMAYADGGLRTETVQEVSVRRANLELALLGPPRNFAATAAIYRIRVENTGDSTADETQVIAALPRGATFVNCTDGGKLDGQKANVQWQIGSLRPGAVRLLEMQVELNQAGDNRFDVQCRAVPDLSVSKSLVTSVEALADLKLHVNDPKGAISVGTDSVYEVRILNRGTKAAEQVRLTGYFSDGIEPVGIRGWRGAISTGQVTFEPIASIHPGQEIVFRITARALKAGDHVFRAELVCSSPETRLASEEWTRYYQSAPEELPNQIARQPESLGDDAGAVFELQPR